MKPNAQRQAEYKARKKEQGMTEVRGIFLPPAMHQTLRDVARAMLKEQNMTKHTSGPWMAEERFHDDGETSMGLSVYAKGEEICSLPGIGRQDFADAALIAAAPELLAALQLLRSTCSASPHAFAVADAAIARAQGD